MMSNIQSIDGASNFGLIILAAGLGKRMRSSIPKVLHELGGKPLIYHILSTVRSVNEKAPIALVVGHGKEKVESYIKNEKAFEGLNITFIFQKEQKGTGDAARCAMDSVWGLARIKEECAILVLPGDSPLISVELIREMVAPLQKKSVMRLLTCFLENPTGYGRIVRSTQGTRSRSKPVKEVSRIVEEKDATLKERQIREVGTSIYFFDSNFLSRALKAIKAINAQGEYYLTDLVSASVREKKKVSVLTWSQAYELQGINDPWELAQTRTLFNQNCIKKWALSGVQFLDSNSVQIEVEVVLGEHVIIGAGAILQGATKIGDRTQVGPGALLKNVVVGDDVTIKAGTIAEDSMIGSFSQIGPYAHLRPGTVVGFRSKIGNFVELKKTQVGDLTSIAHLSYLGDAIVGSNVNIGCGFVTCNFDGRSIEGNRKHVTVIEDEVFLGSACQAVAPVKIGKGSYVASGSTITRDVEPDALSIARSRQVNKLGYAKKLRSKANA